MGIENRCLYRALPALGVPELCWRGSQAAECSGTGCCCGWTPVLKERLGCLEPGSVFWNALTQGAAGCCQVTCEWCERA